ncbi:hypothetical protein [Desulfosporosinus fructosivorans]
MITTRPNFIDSEFFVDEMNNWHLLPNAPREVRKEFRNFMRLTKEPFIDFATHGFSDRNVARRSGRRWASIRQPSRPSRAANA